MTGKTVRLIRSLLSASTLLLISISATSLQQAASAPPAIEISYCGERPQKPPLKRLVFDVTLHNHSDRARWFLLPRALYDKPVPLNKGSIDVVEIRTAAPPSRVGLADFMGSVQLQPESAGGFQALLLPAGANVSVRGLVIQFWGEPPSPLPLRVVIAESLSVNGLPAAQWIGPEVWSGSSGDVDQEQMTINVTRRASESEEAQVTLGGEQEIRIANAMESRCAEKKVIVETPSARLASARNVLIVRSRGSVIPYDVIRSIVEGWGRFTLVEKADDADLVVQVATTGGDNDIRVTSSTSTSENGRQENSTKTSKDLSSSEVTLTVLDARNRRVLWTATETAKFAVKLTARENNLVEAAEKLASKLHTRLEAPVASSSK